MWWLQHTSFNWGLVKRGDPPSYNYKRMLGCFCKGCFWFSFLSPFCVKFSEVWYINLKWKMNTKCLVLWKRGRKKRKTEKEITLKRHKMELLINPKAAVTEVLKISRVESWGSKKFSNSSTLKINYLWIVYNKITFHVCFSCNIKLHFLELTFMKNFAEHCWIYSKCNWSWPVMSRKFYSSSS